MEGAATVGMIEAVGTGITTVLGWLGTVLDAIIGTEGQLNELWPLMAVGIGISAIMLGVKVIKSFAWGT